MLRITIELVPFGVEENKKVIAVSEIWNDGTGTREIGNYQYNIWNDKQKESLVAYGGVKKFKRLFKGPWSLLKKVLKNAKEIKE